MTYTEFKKEYFHNLRLISTATDEVDKRKYIESMFELIENHPGYLRMILDMSFSDYKDELEKHTVYN